MPKQSAPKQSAQADFAPLRSHPTSDIVCKTMNKVSMTQSNALQWLLWVCVATTACCTNSAPSHDPLADNQGAGGTSFKEQADSALEAQTAFDASTYGLAEGWNQLPTPPLVGRTGAAVAQVDHKLLIVGGREYLCPPTADCGTTAATPHADGAIYDFESEQWAPIAEAPFAFTSSQVAVVETAVYLIGHCYAWEACPENRLLRYDVNADKWEIVQAPFVATEYALAQVQGGLVAYRPTGQEASQPDYYFSQSQGYWSPLPADPLGTTGARTLLADGSRWLLFAGGGAPDTAEQLLVAAYEPTSGSWTQLASTNRTGYQVWAGGNQFFLNPHFNTAEGGVYDAAKDAWEPIPNLPVQDLAGVIGADRAAQREGGDDRRPGSKCHDPTPVCTLPWIVPKCHDELLSVCGVARAREAAR